MAIEASSLRRGRAHLAVTYGLLFALGGCAQDGFFAGELFGGEPAAESGMADRARTAVVLGEVLVGGTLSDRLGGPLASAATEARPASVGDLEAQRRADFERQAELLRAQTRRAMVEQRLFEQWRSERVMPASASARASAAEIREAQRLLAGLGLYRGRIDGVFGRNTAVALRQFETRQGLPPTGRLTPELLEQLRRAR